MFSNKTVKFNNYKNFAILLSLIACLMTYFEFEQLKEDHQYLSNISNQLKKNGTIVFISGYSKSGLELLRKILDSSPLIHCNAEEDILDRIITFTRQHYKQAAEMNRLLDAGIDKETIDAASGAFMTELLKSQKKNSPNICNQYSSALLNEDILSSFIPNLKYIFMMVDKKNKRKNKKFIDSDDGDAMEQSYFRCIKMSSEYCQIFYEDMILLEPEDETKKIFNFLNIPWSKHVLKIAKKV